ncbi:outer membrane protein [Helicobacter pylori]|uniref:outer membrane beta-barrel protein n=1 Tax=Helicobacter pylori TaxID=210 RepID=UPI00165B9E2F|nr:outer membrane beta-barrel protein [Helicobacter pylori]WQS21118.1 outer membrane protein [Helicobacter pylori]WQS30456.1 outer membrane protein [Helicobacter pylori]
MKKIALILALWVGFSGAFEPKKSHIYFGAMVGLAPIEIKPVSDSSYTAFLWGAKGGYQFAFFKALALRGEFSYLMAIKPTALHTINTSLLSLNADVLSDFYTYKKYSFGVYGGLGIGYFYQSNHLGMKNSSFMGYNGLFNVGLGSTIAHCHRIELGAKIPFSNTSNSFKNSYFLESVFIHAAYSYAF